MTWIKTIPPQEAPPDLLQCYQTLRSLYPEEYGVTVPALRRPDGSADSIVAAHSLFPDVMLHAMSAFAEMLRPDLPLTRRQHEMIATVVSAQNRCFY
jgi:hypothetical protein